jgi:predicted anti-sigma-YlaC factor YlaD
MNTHESIRNMLSLAAAGALGQQEQLQVEAHTRICEDCRREFYGWSAYATGLQRLPQPAAPADLISRTHARILREREAAAAARWNGATLCGLGIFSWVATVSFWLLVRELSDGRLEVLGTNLVSAGPWFFVSFAVASITAAATALLIGNRGEIGRAL